MKGLIRFFILAALLASVTSCTSRPVEDDLTLEGADSSTAGSELDLGDGGDVVDAGNADSGGGSSEDFADFEGDQQQAGSDFAPSGDQDLALDQPATSEAPAVAEEATPPPAQVDVPTEDPFADSSVADVPAPSQPSSEPPPPMDAPMSTPVDTVAETPAAASSALAQITDLKFKANDNGGTVVVQADQPLTYTTRSNPELRQFVIEVENANLPNRLKRSLNTRDIKGSVGAIDAYQNPGSNTARFVVQLRDGVAEPTVQVEGNSLLIVANGDSGSSAVAAEDSASEETSVAEVGNGKILPGENLADFLAGNTKFYGKKISIETNNMDIRDALNLITEESGVNMVISEEVKGNISLKLRQVPWDQALVVIMKARKLGYTRQGNVLRIAQLQDLKMEEDDAAKSVLARKNLEPLKVRMFPVSYARVEDLEKKIKDFLGDRGKAVGDSRTNSLVVTDIQENLDRVAKLITSLDTQPPQVLIESKIVEAQENFSRNIGVTWGASGAPFKLGSTGRGPVNMTPSFSVNSGAARSGNFSMNLSVGTLDIFGTLQAALSLSESEEQVKILSAPRIMTLTNEKADISQTTEVPVRTMTTSVNGNIETFQFKPLTLKLEVTPQVTADGSIIMKVLVNRQFRGADVSSAGAGAFAINSREANTRVLVKNGQTAVIGGIYQSDAIEGNQGVPWLKDVPVLKYLFSNKNSESRKTELLVFMTPRIVGQTDSASTVAPTEDF